MPMRSSTSGARFTALDGAAGEAETVDGHRREQWRDAKGRVVIEKYDIKGMGHGIPLDPRGETRAAPRGPTCSTSAICSTSHIARFWGLTGSPRKRAARQNRRQ